MKTTSRFKEEMKTHGGKRKGAGRKPRSALREAITVRLEPEDAQAFRELCEKAGKSQSRQISEWIKKNLHYPKK